MSTFIALGSNLAEPLAQLRSAKGALGELGQIEGYSSLYRSAPVGGPAGQDDYLNAVVKLKPRTNDPQTLLEQLQATEHAHGRERLEHWGARTLDLDLLAWDERHIQQPNLKVPHPRMLERPFVMVPLCELEPNWLHPVTKQNVFDILAELDVSGVVKTKLVW